MYEYSQFCDNVASKVEHIAADNSLKNHDISSFVPYNFITCQGISLSSKFDGL